MVDIQKQSLNGTILTLLWLTISAGDWSRGHPAPGSLPLSEYWRHSQTLEILACFWQDTHSSPSINTYNLSGIIFLEILWTNLTLQNSVTTRHPRHPGHPLSPRFSFLKDLSVSFTDPVSHPPLTLKTFSVPLPLSVYQEFSFFLTSLSPSCSNWLSDCYFLSYLFYFICIYLCLISSPHFLASSPEVTTIPNFVLLIPLIFKMILLYMYAFLSGMLFSQFFGTLWKWYYAACHHWNLRLSPLFYK